MAWTLFVVPTTKKSEMEAVLRDDLLSRQSHKVRDAAAAGGPSGSLYVLLEGSDAAMRRADELLAAVGVKPAPADAEPVYRRFKEEEENASTGMGLFFTED
ncbi:MAG TPA: hypothetical protein VEY07_03895 [Thermoplasmata archaeon]|nr:hypothetical protein [Thermoplasmata archaeon]